MSPAANKFPSEIGNNQVTWKWGGGGNCLLKYHSNVKFRIQQSFSDVRVRSDSVFVLSRGRLFSWGGPPYPSLALSTRATPLPINVWRKKTESELHESLETWPAWLADKHTRLCSTPVACFNPPAGGGAGWAGLGRAGQGVNSGKEWGRLLVLCVHKHSRAAGRKGKKMCRTRLQAVWSFCNPTLAWHVNASPEPD